MLVIRPSLREEDISVLQKNAQRKTFARGEVINSAHGLVFESNSDDASHLLEQDLKRYFCKKVSALQNARVTTRKQRHTNTQSDFFGAD